MVGFGGGSSYIALLILLQIPYEIAPSISLICNIIVVAGGAINFYRNKLIDLSFVYPFLITSVPFSFIGGSIEISKTHFQFVLGIALLFSAIRMIFINRNKFSYGDFNQKPPLLNSLLIGTFLGFLSGLVGIGGGIFLAPVLYFFKWGSPRKNAATASLFILVNSIAGLLGQGQKNFELISFYPFIPLFFSVIVGGQLGSWLCNFKISPRKIELSTSFLILLVSVRLLLNIS